MNNNKKQEKIKNSMSSSDLDEGIKKFQKQYFYDIKTDSEKNYTVAFNSKDYFLTGGDNSTVNIYNF